ncbi:MAG: fibrobacter succinogenes major paralogous domain-containing protein [Ignavibacteriae bacterium]|nr:fibrobacter succinogenes major paralogous domain-containing protein [Ignavibacteriota bacterium]
MRQTTNSVIIFFTVVIIFSVLVKKSISQVTDIDGNVYKTVKIGNQEWMAENLNVEHYRNGDSILQVQDAKEWSILTTGAWCYYENNSENGKTNGKLYNLYAVNDSRGLAPEGWHIPNKAEFAQLSNYLGGDEIAGGKLKSTTLWYNPNTGATNESGFTIYPGGSRISNGDFNNIGKDVWFWSWEGIGNDAFTRYLSYKDSTFYLRDYHKRDGLYVRFIRD